MLNKELIEKLKQLPSEDEVFLVTDSRHEYNYCILDALPKSNNGRRIIDLTAKRVFK